MSAQRRASFRTWGATDAEMHVARTAHILRDVVTQFDVRTFQNFVPLVLLRGHPLNQLLNLALQMRANRRTRRTVWDVSRWLQTATRAPVWLKRVLQRCFTLYTVLRAMAVPMQPRPDALGNANIRITGRLSRYLAGPGIRWESRGARISVADQAVERRHTLRDQMQGSQWVAWVDNYNTLRYVVDPVLTMQALNATALAVMNLRTVAWKEAWSVPTPADLVNAVPALVDDIIRYGAVLRTLLNTIAVHGPPPGQVRVPLDVPRSGPISVQWHPLALLNMNLGTLQDFIKIFQVSRSLQNRTGHVMPLLVDEKVHHQMLRCVYGMGYQAWGFRDYVRQCPPLYGVWHVYKHVALTVWRKFLPYVTWLTRGALGEGEPVGLRPKLRTVELLYAAVLQNSAALNQQLGAWRVNLRNWKVVINARLHGLGFVEGSDSPIGRAMAAAEGQVVHRWTEGHDSLIPRDRPTARAVQDDTVDRLQLRLHVVNDQLFHVGVLLRLVAGYIPAVFTLGHMVRECHYEDAWADSSSKQVREAMFVAFQVLLRCQPQDEMLRSEYFRSMTLAVLLWTPTFNTLPMALFSEEPCEALLAQLESAARSHPQRRTVQAVSDLYSLVQPTGTTDPGHRVSHPTEAVQQRIATQLQRASTGGRVRPAYVAWLGQTGKAVATVAWPVHPHFPVPFDTPVLRQTLETAMYETLTLLFRSTPSVPCVSVLNDQFETLVEGVSAGRRRAVDAAFQDTLLKTGRPLKSLLDAHGAFRYMPTVRAPSLMQRDVLLEEDVPLQE